MWQFFQQVAENITSSLLEPEYGNNCKRATNPLGNVSYDLLQLKCFKIFTKMKFRSRI